MRKTLQILGNSLKLAMQELHKNKLRTFLSLFGVTIGIFCIIGVLSAVSSLEKNVQDGIKSLGSNTIYIDKWRYGGGDGDYPWWKYLNRPSCRMTEARMVKQKVGSDIKVAFNMSSQGMVEFGNTNIDGLNFHGITEEFDDIQPMEIQYGRYLSASDFALGSANIILGYDIAEKLFDNPEKAVGQEVKLKGRKGRVAGVVRKQGKGLISGWDFDNSVVLSYAFMQQMFEERYNNPKIIVAGPANISADDLKGELRGAMRSIRRIGPTEEDNFELNAVSDLSNAVDNIFASVNLGGWLIGLLSLIVGAFGIANIMFVTVRERTPFIGLKKAIGAKRRTILMEFLLESSFICIIGGLIGLGLVISLAAVFSRVFNFPIYVSMQNLGIAFGICLGIGILAGIIPAAIAARMDPVVAIRSK
ncbi:MAG: FtsX-like permease family protein [Bacteroidetes bacterium]|nr:FtsX-like permease family protein [Bacteroidota bacterium]